MTASQLSAASSQQQQRQSSKSPNAADQAGSQAEPAANKKPAKNKRIISRMLSISAIHTTLSDSAASSFGSQADNTGTSSGAGPAADQQTLPGESQSQQSAASASSAAAAAASPAGGNAAADRPPGERTQSRTRASLPALARQREPALARSWPPRQLTPRNIPPASPLPRVSISARFRLAAPQSRPAIFDSARVNLSRPASSPSSPSSPNLPNLPNSPLCLPLALV